MRRLTRDETAKPVSRDQIIRRVREQGNMDFTCSTDHEQGWQPYPVDPYSAMCDDHPQLVLQSLIRIYNTHLQHSSRPSEHPPVRGKYVKTLGGIIGCNDKKTLHGIKTGSPMVVTLGQQYNVVEKPTGILYTYINRHAGTPNKRTILYT